MLQASPSKIVPYQLHSFENVNENTECLFLDGGPGSKRGAFKKFYGCEVVAGVQKDKTLKMGIYEKHNKAAGGSLKKLGFWDFKFLH